MKKLSFYRLCAISSALALTIATELNAAQTNEVELGSTENVMASLSAQFANPKLQGLQFNADQKIATEIRDLYNRNGGFSASGIATGNPNSVFYLKGNARNLSGYLVLLDSKKAYKYETNKKGIVIVKPIKITDVYPDLDADFYKGFDAQGLTTLAVAHPVYSPFALRQARHIGPYNNEDVTKLESKPGSPYVFYLNTTAVMSGSTPLNGVTKEQMYRAWQSIADQYSMLNLNVTTNRGVYDSAKAANLLRTGIINFVNQDGRSNAPVHSFGTTSAGTLYRNPASGFDYGYGIGMTGAHEVGHQMGMLHDGGGSGGEYFEGIAAYQWGPIMGNYWQGGSWTNQLFQWSKGEYNTATNREDDLRIMTVDESVPYMADDNVSGKPLVLSGAGDILPNDNFGQIERNTDTDAFNINLLADSELNLKIDPIEYLRMLDVDATVYDRNNAVVARSNLSVNRSAEFVKLTLPAGAYSLVIKGGAEGTPQNGFSNYSSLGWYAMKGTLLAGNIPSDPVLTSGVPLSNQSATTGNWKYYAIDVPSGKTKITFSINGANGDADLFGRAGSKPTTSAYGCKSDGPTSVETCSINSPTAGRYYLGVYAYATFSGLTVTATVN